MKMAMKAQTHAIRYKAYFNVILNWQLAIGNQVCIDGQPVEGVGGVGNGVASENGCILD